VARGFAEQARFHFDDAIDGYYDDVLCGNCLARWFLYGDHWLGPTFLSLVDPSDARLINTIPIHRNDESPEDEDFAVPFLTLNDPYDVSRPDKDGKGKPALLHLQDFTGESVAGQFVLYDHVVSGIAAGSVQGYSAKSDTALQYPIELTLDNFKPVVQGWANQVFETKPSRPAYWKFTWEPGHGKENWVDEEVRFDPARQLFIEKKTLRPYTGSDQFQLQSEYDVSYGIFGAHA
jgi:hypothetical protein